MVDERRQEPAATAAATAEPHTGTLDTGNQGAASPAPAATEPAALRRHRIAFDATAEAAYHAIREGFLGGLHRTLMALVLVGGTASFSAMVGALGGFWQQAAAVLVVAASIVDLVFDLPGKARVHAQLRARHHQIVARLHTCDDGDLAALTAELQMIYAEEPPGHRMVQALAHNAAIDAFYEDDRARALRLTIPWRDRLTGHVLRLNSRAYERAGSDPA